MTVYRPKFQDAWRYFKHVRVSVKEVGHKIGGKVMANTESGKFKNACPIRMSYVLNNTKVLIPRDRKYAVVSGADGKWYMYRVNDMLDFMTEHFGPPDITAQYPKLSDFYGKKGILVISGDGWSTARGHVTLFDGAICSDSCHLTGDPDNGTFIPKTASLWILP